MEKVLFFVILRFALEILFTKVSVPNQLYHIFVLSSSDSGCDALARKKLLPKLSPRSVCQKKPKNQQFLIWARTFKQGVFLV
jgi:hypothetical protein